MPTSQIYKKNPVLVAGRQTIKEYCLKTLGKCELTGKTGNLAVHECLVPANDIKGIKDQRVWKLVCFHPVNIALIDNGIHLNKLPGRIKFKKIVLGRPKAFYQNFPLDNAFASAEKALTHWEHCWELLYKYKVIKTRMKVV